MAGIALLLQGATQRLPGFVQQVKKKYYAVTSGAKD